MWGVLGIPASLWLCSKTPGRQRTFSLTKLSGGLRLSRGRGAEGLGVGRFQLRKQVLPDISSCYADSPQPKPSLAQCPCMGNRGGGILSSFHLSLSIHQRCSLPVLLPQLAPALRKSLGCMAPELILWDRAALELGPWALTGETMLQGERGAKKV